MRVWCASGNVSRMNIEMKNKTKREMKKKTWNWSAKTEKVINATMRDMTVSEAHRDIAQNSRGEEKLWQNNMWNGSQRLSSNFTVCCVCFFFLCGVCLCLIWDVSPSSEDNGDDEDDDFAINKEILINLNEYLHGEKYSAFFVLLSF